MTASHFVRRVLVYALVSLYVFLFLAWFVSYFYLRGHSPRQPVRATGHVYAQHLKQPFDVYVTRFQRAWLDYGVFASFIPFGVGCLLNSRWKIFPERRSIRSIER